MWYIYTVECYEHSNNKIMPFAATWMDVDTVILSEVNQRKTSIMMIAYMWDLGEQNGTSELTKQKQSHRCRKLTSCPLGESGAGNWGGRD